MKQSTLNKTALAILRVIVGFIFAAHWFQKFNEFTILERKRLLPRWVFLRPNLLHPSSQPLRWREELH